MQEVEKPSRFSSLRSRKSEVEIDTEAMRGVNVNPGDDERAIEEMLAAGATRI